MFRFPRAEGKKPSRKEFRRPEAAEENEIRFWGGLADPKNTSCERRGDFSVRKRVPSFVQPYFIQRLRR